MNHVTIVNNTSNDISELFFHNAGNHTFQEKILTEISSVRCSHGERTVGLDSLVMKVGLFPTLKPGETTIVDISFKTRFSNIADPNVPTKSSKKDTVIYNGIHFYPVLEYFYTDGWRKNLYGKTIKPFSNFSSYKVRLTTPNNVIIGASSKIIKEEKLDTGHTRYYINDDLTLGISTVFSENLIKKHEKISGIDVEIVFPKSRTRETSMIKERLEKLIPFYESQLGFALMDKLVITMGYSFGEQAVSNSNYLILQNGYSNEHVLDHEIAHQWFGFTVQAEDPSFSWMNESLAEYASWLFLQSIADKPDPFTFTGPIPDLDIWKEVQVLELEDWTRILMEVIGNRSLPPVYDPGKQVSWESASTIYSKYISGRHALQMLQVSVGEEAMKQVLVDYFHMHKGNTASIDDIIQLVRKRVSDEEADNFKLALTTNLSSDIIIEKVESSKNTQGSWDHNVYTETRGQWFLPVDVLFITDTNDSIDVVGVDVSSSETININTKDELRSVIIDPYKRLFDSNRFNNKWPRQISLQPDYGLPSWETYRVYYRPRIKKDWRGKWRTGVQLSGGLGINMMPIRPAFYQNLFDVEITFSTGVPSNNWGGRVNYRTPLESTENTYWEFETGYEHPKKWTTISFNNYLGEPKYLAVHGESYYSRMTTTISSSEYLEADIHDWWNRGRNIKLKEKWTIFSYTADQRYMIESYLIGGFQDEESFYNIGFSADLETRKIGEYIIRVHGESGFVWDERDGNELAYRLLYIPKLWQAKEGRTTLFRGVSEDEKDWHNNIVSGGLSVGYKMEGPAWPMVYIDGAITSDHEGKLIERIDHLKNQNNVYLATGIGIESQTLMEIGLYFPFWVSHPIGGENKIALRALLQWGFYF